MDTRYNDWLKHAQERQVALGCALEKNGGRDLVTDYKTVAFAFPSTDPNPYSFEYPIIDQERLHNWSEAKGWKAQLAPENAPGGEKHRPPVRFTKR